jgi:hypothetical protein
MQQRTRRLAILIGGTLIATVGVLAACSTDNGTTPLPGQGGGDSGRDSQKGDGNVEPEDTKEGGSKDATASADCGEAPQLRSNDKGGFFCAFFGRDAAAGDAGAGGNRNCRNDEICCNPGRPSGGGDFPPSFCAELPQDDKAGESSQTACADQAADHDSTWNVGGSTTWQCGDKNNCGDNEVCCMFTWLDAGAMDKVNIGNSTDKDVPKACGALQAFKTGGTRCAANCNADEIKLCSKTDDNCEGAQKCTPFEALGGRDLGYCK